MATLRHASGVATGGRANAAHSAYVIWYLRGASDAGIDGESLRAFVRSQLASYKVPKAFAIVAELPKTGAGKIDKRTLAERWTGEGTAPAG